MFRAFILVIGLVGLMGLVWMAQIPSESENRLVKLMNNPFSQEAILIQNRSIVDYTVVDRLQKRRV